MLTYVLMRAGTKTEATLPSLVQERSCSRVTPAEDLEVRCTPGRERPRRGFAVFAHSLHHVGLTLLVVVRPASSAGVFSV